MAVREPIEVTVEIEGTEVDAGTLWIHERGEQSATFRYADTYLANPAAYELDPALPLTAGVFQTPLRRTMFNGFADSAPDRWGQNLMRREERERARAANVTPRTLAGADFLLGVRDDVRQGAIRFRSSDGSYHSSHPRAVPRLIEMGRLLRAVDRLDAREPIDRDIKDLIDAGGSLGGARPKAAVLNHANELAIAKFPRKGSDDWDVISWEELELSLARRAKLDVAHSKRVDAGGRRVLVVDRFDRRAGRRIGFASALTMLEAADGERHSYLEIAEVIEKHSVRPDRDLHELYRRVVFSVLTGNTDDHLRNHGFLRHGRGWTLSPAYDLNPNPDRPDRLSTTIGFDDDRADIETAISVAAYFRLSAAQARSIIVDIEAATRDWKHAAKQLGLPEREIELMSTAFDSDQRLVARSLS